MSGCERRWEYRGPTCCEITHQTNEYLDDRLPIQAQIKMTLHLASCDHCRTYVKQVEFVQQTLALLLKHNPTPSNQYLLRRRFTAIHTH